MILRYNYFKNKIDHEKELEKLSEDKIKYISNEELEELAGTFTESILKFNTKYEKLPLVLKPGTTNTFEVKINFTQEEYNIIKKENPTFASILYSYKDRLALDKDGNLYDIDDTLPKSFQWYLYYLKD